jgi:hypothetical protein
MALEFFSCEGLFERPMENSLHHDEVPMNDVVDQVTSAILIGFLILHEHRPVRCVCFALPVRPPHPMTGSKVLVEYCWQDRTKFRQPVSNHLKAAGNKGKMGCSYCEAEKIP